MPKTNTPIITPELKLLLDKLSFYREHITCTKCAATNTIHYIDEDPTNAADKIKFQCSTPNCSSKPSTVMMEREIANLKKFIPYIRPTKVGSKIPKPSKSNTSRSKSINAPDTDSIVIDENEDTHIPTTKNDSQLETLIELIKTLQTRLTDMEIQLNNTNNKNVAEQKHQKRIVRALTFIRAPTSKAVAKQFLEQQIITQEQHDQFMKHLSEKEQEAMKNNNTTNNANKANNTQTDLQDQTNNIQQVQDENAEQFVLMINLRISYPNAGSLSVKAINEILSYCNNADLLFITETWLLPNHTIPTNWTQFHTHTKPPQSQFNTNTSRGQMGISLLINPEFQKKHNIYIDTQKQSK